MKRFHLIVTICCLAITQIVVGQTEEWKPVYTSKWGHLLSAMDDELSVIGIFSTEAPVMVLDSTATHYKVKVSNGDVGYIEKQPLAKAMFARRSEGEPVQYFYRGKEGGQSPHQYVQVSGLRVRAQPSTSAKVLRSTRLNEMIFVNYIPLYPDGWVYIGDHFHERPEFIQSKFLGMEVTYAQMLADYLEARGKDVEQELVLVGRLRELAWSGTAEQRKEGLQYYQQSWIASGNENTKVDIAFERLLADKLATAITDYESYLSALKRLDMHYLVKGMRLTDGKITDQQTVALGMQRVADIPDSPECGWYPLYFYQAPHVLIAFEENVETEVVGGVYTLEFKDDITLVLGKEHIDKSYSERDFVMNFGHLLSVDWIGSPHVYQISNADAGVFIIEFKDGYPVRFISAYYC